MYLCNNCGKQFTRVCSLKRHLTESCSGNEGPTSKKFRLEKMSSASTINEGASTSRVNERPSTSNNAGVICNCCNKMISSNTQVSHWRTLQHRTNACVDFMPGVQLIQTAFKSRIASYRVHSEHRYSDYKIFFESIKNKVIHLLSEAIKIHKAVKVNMELFGRYILQTQEIVDNKSFNTTNKVIDSAADLNDVFYVFVDIMTTQMSEFQERDSGWALQYIMYVEVNVNKFSGFGGSSYIKLPYSIEKKTAVVNVHNQDQCCFLWAIISALHPVRETASDVSSYPHFSTLLDIEGMTFPVKLRDIPKFELRNNISINVYTLESNFENDKIVYRVVGPLYFSQKKLHIHINLLLITNECGNSHYCWIKNLSRLVSSQISNSQHKKYFCDGCLLYFGNQNLLFQHQQNDCNHLCTSTPSAEIKKNKYGAYVPGNILKFVNFEKQLEVPFVVYADFESVLKPIDTCEPNPQYSYTNRTFRHEPYSFAYIIKCSYNDSLSKFELYRGANAASVFVNKIENDLTRIYENYLKPIIPMEHLTREKEYDLNRAEACGICEKPFLEGEQRVKDHCHLTGKIRFHAHSTCNLNYKIPNFIPIIFHNMSGYDCHMFIKELFSDKKNADVIAQSKEKYISFTKYLHVDTYIDKKACLTKKFLKLRFIDSFKFMASSLQNLGENLRSDLFHETRKYFPDESQFRLMRQKGVFPYSFVDNLDKLNLKYLPSKEQFYDNLSETHIKDVDYERAQKVWNLFGCHTLGEYSDIYLKSDVLLLCDVFQNFRKICFENYKLDPTQYFTAPGLAWDAMLKLTNVELELLTDIDMVHLLKRGVRGGISQCSERKHIANNIFLPNYNADEPSSFIMYLDATNLYGHSMSQALPTGGFTWLTENEISTFDITQIPDDGPQGFILEVDVYYPQELHDMHSDLPFLVENMVPPNSKSKLKKLIPNLNDKINYVVHYKNLQQAIKNGLVLKKIHRVLKFNQSCWLKKYIDLNTKMRNGALNKFEKRFL
ncbi:hypothetical protein NQ318_007519 [Aromia moschata]|uniref:C2H2-type domain-containing protein n=1 Tax=Aromia moschata TaxID=1265417 RepID=A0AAV8YG55_9CUCU|nr:hypothetical protein NQ318_007519 [Aromia moschata]